MTPRSGLIDAETVPRSERRIGIHPGATGRRDLETFLTHALAEAVFGAAFVCAAVVALLGQSKPTERLGYVLIALVVVPASVTLAARRGRNTHRSRNCSSEAVMTLALTVAVIAGVRAADPSRTSAVLLVGLVAVRAAMAVRSALDDRRHAGPLRTLPTAIVPVLLVIVAIPFVPRAALSWGDVAIAVACCPALVVLVRLARGWPRPARRVLDVGTVSLCTLLVFDLGRPVKLLAVNQNYFLGPTLDVLHGQAMLVGTFSQYGFGMFDGLGAFFSIAPIGYGSFTLLLSALTALLFGAVYGVLRLSTGSQLLAVTGLVVAVVLNVFGQLNSYTYYPSTGALRFGLVWLVILLSVAAARTPRRARLLDGLALVVVGASAAWSGETGAYCLGAAGAIACLDALAHESSRGARCRAAIRGVGRCAAASLCGLLLFTGVTRVAAGAWPDWGAYAEFIRLYTTGGLGAIPIGAWSPGLALGAFYAASAIALIALVTLRPATVRARPAMFRAIAGLTAMGALVFTYFLGRAAPNNLFHIAPPAVALLFIWTGIADITLVNRRTATIAIGAAMFIGAFVVAAERDGVSDKYPHTALAALVGGSPSLTTQVRSLWHEPVVDPEAAQVARFVSSLGNARARLVLVLFPKVESEALLRLDRANAVGTSNPCQESLSALGPPRVMNAVRGLTTGAILVTSSAPVDRKGLLPIQRYALALIRSRFRLRKIGSDGRGHEAFVLAAHAPARATGARAIAAPTPLVPPLTGCA